MENKFLLLRVWHGDTPDATPMGLYETQEAAAAAYWEWKASVSETEAFYSTGAVWEMSQPRPVQVEWLDL